MAIQGHFSGLRMQRFKLSLTLREMAARVIMPRTKRHISYQQLGAIERLQEGIAPWLLAPMAKAYKVDVSFIKLNMKHNDWII